MKPVINEIGKFVYTRGVLLDQITKLNKNFDSLLRNIFNTLKPEEIEFYAVKNHKDTFGFLIIVKLLGIFLSNTMWYRLKLKLYQSFKN